jgi:stearoyl-CoA desaturase (delta-9 desaturase)
VSFPVAVLVGLSVTQIAVVVTTVYLHRALAHRALTMRPVAALPLRFLVWITTGMRRREWVAVHRRHHANTDAPSDPHSPARLGFWRVQFTNPALYRRVARDGITVRRYARDLPPDLLDRRVFDHGITGLGVGIGILCVTFGWATGLVASAVHAVSYVMLSGAVNAVGHTYGRRRFANSGANSQVLALLTAGEGLHNNHHASPTSARFAFRRAEIDPGWWFIRTLLACNMATLRQSPKAGLRKVA